jgi:hypothetical protein
MMIKIRGGPLIAYRDYTHFEDLRTIARKQQMEWIAESGGPLDFAMSYAEEEVDDFAHGCAWHNQSVKCFREMLLMSEPETDSDNEVALVFTFQLHVAIQTALLVVLPLLGEIDEGQDNALLVPAMLKAARTAIENYFDNALSNEFFYETTYDDEDDDAAVSASDGDAA